MAMPPPNILYLHSHDTGRYVQPYGYPGPDPEHPAARRPGGALPRGLLRGPDLLRQPRRLLTGQYGHNNGMLGLAHRGWALNDYRQHIVHTLREAGYRSTLIGEQHISATRA